MLKSIIALIKGHFTIFKHMFKKPVTLEYPEVRPDLNERFRGKHEYDINKCIGCLMCVKVCPANAICIEKNKNDDGKMTVNDYNIDYNKCIFCGNCAFYCPVNAVWMTKEFELATDNKIDLCLDYKSGEADNNE